MSLCVVAAAQNPVANFTASPVSGCSPLVVNFTDASTGNPATWFWDFGNGATSTLKNPSTTYFIAGTYTVTLTVANTTGTNTLTRQAYVTVYGKPVVNFRASDSTGCFPFPVAFTDLSTASTGTANNTWIWDFGDGGQSTQQSPQNTYGNSGSYTVSVKVTNDKGCWATFTKQAYVVINGGVSAGFNFTQPVICRTPVTVSFGNVSTGPGNLGYQWNFGDGNTSTLPTPVHTYTTPGSYPVTLVTTSTEGCTDTMRKPDVINVQNFSTSFTAPENICMGNAATIINTSSAGATATLWTFGDGTISTASNAVKTFTVPGTYTIKLVQSYGACTDSVSKTIVVNPRPTATFSAAKTSFCQTPASVSFVNTSTGAASYQWFFGDGSSSSEASPTHTYSAYGLYDISLIVTNAAGCTDTLRMPQYINVTKPVIQFISLPVRGCVPYTAGFTSSVTSSDPVATYAWDFGDGNTSTAPTPSHTYTTQGSYTVSLTITTTGGCTQTYSLPAAVMVGTKPVVNFSAQPPVVCAFRPVQFTNSTPGTGLQFEWFFGDGGTSGSENPLHEYGDTGVFDVKLIVTNNGCKDSLTINDMIKVKPPIAAYSFATQCSNRLRYTFNNASIGATTWVWNFGDGTTSTGLNPVHDFPGYGTYNVTLTVSNDTCNHQKKTAVVIANPTPDFTALPRTACKGSSIQFVADTVGRSGIVSWQWRFGYAGATGTGTRPSHQYLNSGLYSITLIVTDAAGCMDSMVKTDYIRITGPTAAFTANNTNGCKGLTASFTDASQDDGISAVNRWQWNLGDGTLIDSTRGGIIQHLYTQAGSFAVSLKVTDGGGCTDTVSVPATVNVSNIKADFSSMDTVSCPGAMVNFTNVSVANSTFTSNWQFGNGTGSMQLSPTVSYPDTGLYTIKLVIKDSVGCLDSLVRPAYISIKKPRASFSVSDSASSCTPFQVRFTNTSANYNSFVWDLGGGTSTLLNPIQYYNTPGIYHTSLTVTGAGGCTDSMLKNITVYDVSTASVSYTPLDGCKPLLVSLQATAPPYMNYVWDFGDGVITTGTATAIQHVYNFFGDFVPKLILTDASGCIIPVTGPDTIHIKGATTKFGLDRRLLCDSGAIHFIDSTTFNNPIISYTWNFGDGATSSQPSPTHYYTAPGLYPVSLNVLTQNLCVDTFRLSVPVKVVQSPSVRIEGDSIICVGDGMNHMGEFNRPDTSVVRWAWNFPNGNTAAVRLPERQYYNKAGDFSVQTIATNTSGCADTARKNIKVNPLPWVTMPSTLTTRTGSPVQIPATYHGGVVNYSWAASETLNCLTCPEPVASPKFNTAYRVNFTDTNGCRNKGDIQVIVFCNNDNVFVPNTFSPNADGSNDVFYVRGKGLNRVKSLRVFNRWGQVVFEKQNFGVNDATAGWDGKYKGADASPDVYVYQLEIWCDNSTVVKFDGNVALVR